MLGLFFQTSSLTGLGSGFTNGERTELLEIIYQAPLIEQKTEFKSQIELYI